jgi:hypothetical protein
MSLQAWVAVLQGFGALLAGARFLMQARRPLASRPIWLSVLLLQPLAAALLYFTLFPPQNTQRTDRLVIASAGTTAAQAGSHGRDATVLALPEAPALPGAIRAPDLATALRQHPQASQLLILGQGLPMRDRDAARGHALQFIATPLPRGLIELQSPTRATVGQRWQVTGAVNALPGGSIELLDPSGHRAERSPGSGPFSKLRRHGLIVDPSFAYRRDSQSSISQREIDSRGEICNSPAAICSRNSAAENQRASCNSAPTRTGCGSASALKPSISAAGNGHGCEAR